MPITLAVLLRIGGPEHGTAKSGASEFNGTLPWSARSRDCRACQSIVGYDPNTAAESRRCSCFNQGVGDDQVELKVRTPRVNDIREGQFIHSSMRPLARAAILTGHFQVGEVLNVSHVGFTKFEEFCFERRPSRVLIELVKSQLQSYGTSANSDQ